MYPKHNNINPIAVVMTTYNGASFLAEQIDSILAQTLTPSLIIVSDDCSEDETCLIVEKYQAEGKLKLYRNETRVGVVANFKHAISLVPTGYYFALSDQDDIWYPNKLARCFEEMQKIEIPGLPAMVYSDLCFIDATKKILNPSFRNELGHDKYAHCLDTLLFGNFVLGCTTLCNESMKSHIAEMPVNPNFNHDAWMAMVAFCIGNTYSINEPLVYYRKHEKNVTISEHKKSSIFKRYLQHIKFLFSQNNYLAERFTLVNLFLDKYVQSLSEEKRELLANFISLQNKNYFVKKISFEKAFYGKWIKRFS